MSNRTHTITNANDETLSNEVKELEEINKRQEERIQNLEIRALQLTNLYFVFQGVILSSIATKKLECHHAWVPFVLSLLAALLNTAALSHTIYCFIKCSEELDQNREDLRDKKEKLKSTLPNIPQQASRQSPDSCSQQIRRVFSAVSFVLFLGFSVVILYGCFKILC